MPSPDFHGRSCLISEESLPRGVVTEADVEARVVLPYLTSLKIQPDQIRAQRTFTIRLGRNASIPVGGRDTRTGRLDYLIVNADGRPLFVVEVKAPSDAITDDDRDQGISYARLLHPMAPLVLLTNTQVSRLYDTITREEIGSADDAALIRGGGSLTSEEDLRFRYEALQHFVGFSAENVAAFSLSQIGMRMRSLRGGDGRYDKKYEPDLYLPRDLVRRSIKEYLESDRSVFVLGGDSGYGKTNEMCSLAEELGQTCLVLFFAGAEVHGSLVQTLAAEFEWFFSEGLPLPQLCRRISALAKSSGRPLVVFIDGIDESPIPALPQELSDLAVQLEQFEGHIRLVVSAKPTDWMRFANIRGVAAPLMSSVYHDRELGSGSTPAKESPKGQQLLSYSLERFSTDERDAAIERYSKVLGLQSKWSHAMREAVADPFLLRIVCEVAAETGAIPADPAELELVRRYVMQKLARTTDPARALRELVAVARSLATANDNSSWEAEGHLRGLQRNRVSSIPSVQEAIVRMDAGLSLSDPIADELVSFGVLLRSLDLDGRPTLAFAYDRVRDYILATHVFELQRLDKAAFREMSSQSFSHGVKSSALLWYLPSVTLAQWHGFVEASAGQVERLLDTYEAFRAEFSVDVRKHMEPGRGDLVGAVFAGAPQRPWFDLALFPRSSNAAPRVRYDPLAFNVLRGRRDLPIGGVPASAFGPVRGGLGFWFLRDPQKFAAELVLAEFKRIVKEGLLPEVLDKTLLTERVLALAWAHRQRLGLGDHRYGYDGRVADRYSLGEICPLDLEDLHARVHRQLGLTLYRNAVQNERSMAERDRVAQLPEHERPEFITTHITWTEELLGPLRERAETEVAQGKCYFGVPNEPALSLLAEAIYLLRPLSSRVEHALLPPPDVTAGLITRSFEDGYSDAQLQLLLTELFKHALVAWKGIRTAAFSARLRTILAPPPRLVAAIGARRDELDLRQGDFIGTVCYGPAIPADSNARIESGAVAVIVAPRTPPPVTPVGQDSHAVFVDTSEGRYRMNSYRLTGMMSILFPDDAPEFVKYGNGSPEQWAPIRAYMYKMANEMVEHLTVKDLLSLGTEFSGSQA